MGFIAEIWPNLKGQKGLFALNILLAILLAAAGPFALSAQAHFIDVIDGLIGAEFKLSAIALPSFFLLLSFLLPHISLLSGYLNSKLAFTMNIRWNAQINHITSKIPYHQYEQEDTYNKLTQLNENNLYNAVVSCVFSFVSAVFSIIMFSFVLLRASLWLTVSVLLLAPFAGYFSSKIADRQYKKAHELNPDRRRGLYKSSILRDREYSKEIRINNSKNFMINDWLNTQRDIDNKKLKIDFHYGFYSALIAKTEYLIVFINLILLLTAYLHGTITLGFFVSLSNQIFTMRLLTKIQALASQLSTVKSVHQSYITVLSLVNVILPENANGDVLNKDTPVTIEFKNVSYRYPNAEDYVLRNISFFIKYGESIAVVGENGAGKSTLIKLLLGLYEPNEGEVLINGIKAAALNPEIKAGIFGAAFQDYAKFSLTLKENLSFFDTKEEIIKAAQQFNIDALAADFDKGYDTVLGKSYGESADVSEGQWQSIAIVRALIGSKKVYIFDEPTAALDPVHGVETFEKISGVTKTHTAIYITHRLGFTNKVDRIFLIKDNRLFEEGSFDNLLNRKGEFYKLYVKQRSLYLKKELP